MKKRLFVVVFLLILCLGILLFASCGTVKKTVAKTGTNMSLKLDHAHHLVISSADGELIEVTDAGIVQAISDIFASVVFVDGPSMKDQDGLWPSLSWYDTANRMILSCKVDYLMSWKNSIKNCPASILRNENAGINYMKDDKLPIDPNRFYTIGRQFPETGLTGTAVSGFQFILITR